MTHFDHVAFQVSDLDRSLEFYADKLGFTLVSRAVNPREQEAYAFLALGDLRLELIQLRHPTPLTRPDPQPPYCPHLAIATSDMAQTLARLYAAGVTILRGPLEIEGEESWVYFCDPDNNILEYIQWFRKG
jgi:catechol 2,3-dioxygenase-like lactoylglutathione lyase family enzyme